MWQISPELKGGLTNDDKKLLLPQLDVYQEKQKHTICKLIRGGIIRPTSYTYRT